MQGTRDRGINRVMWNLQDTPSMPIRLRTTPLYADWVDLGPNRVRSGGNGISILQPPGTYTVALEVDGRTLDAAAARAEGPELRGHRGRHRRTDRRAQGDAGRPRLGGFRHQSHRVDAAAVAGPRGDPARPVQRQWNRGDTSA